MKSTRLKAAMAQGHAVIERRMRYFCEAEARLSELKNRTRCAKYWIGRREPAEAINELRHLVSEAEKLRLHLEAWSNYV